jgi:predicted amidophosphoribosyltransferase
VPTVGELSALYENVLLGPRRGPDVCGTCFNFTAGYDRCWACAHGQPRLDAVAPISYSVAREQLHHALASYKRLDGDVARRLRAILAAILWRFLTDHEVCVAKAADTNGFDLVTTVPSGDPQRDQTHPLRTIVGELVNPTRDRHRRLLRRTDAQPGPRAFSTTKFEATTDLSHKSVLLIDDTWTTGASAQSAAAALKQAGAERVAAVVIGRHLNREWHENDRRLRGIARPFDWQTCALCATPVGSALRDVQVCGLSDSSTGVPVVGFQHHWRGTEISCRGEAPDV